MTILSLARLPLRRAALELGRAEGFAMQPKERRETGEQDLFRSRLDQIIDLQHALVRLARAIDWLFLEEKFGAVYTDKPGHPPLPTRLMAGLAILKHMQNHFDEALCEHWVRAPGDCDHLFQLIATRRSD